MSVEPMPLHAVAGGDPDRRLSRAAERRAQVREQMERLWEEAWEYAGRGDRETAEDVFHDANNMGQGFPTDEKRICRVSGTVALGYARLPFTDWSADVAVSHGSEEQRPTALNRYRGWEDMNGTWHNPARLILRPSVKAGVVTGIAVKGAEALFQVLGLVDPGASVQVEWDRRGVPFLVRQGPAEAVPMGVEG